MQRPTTFVLLFAGLTLATGCGTTQSKFFGIPTPAESNINTRDLIDPPAQLEADRLLDITRLVDASNKVRNAAVAIADAADPGRKSRPPKNVLCLSGGGAYGAFTAGILVGWTSAGDRPDFDTVTGVSTGALIAPFAFLGPRYDAAMKRFYTDIRTRDIYNRQIIRGLFSEALADNTPLANRIRDTLTSSFIDELATEHRKGRRLYIGTTEMEGKRFVVWDLGAIACREDIDRQEMITQVLLGSSAIPGFFPASNIPVTIDGRQYIEHHGDGGVSEGIFFRPPYTPETNPSQYGMAGTKIWCVIAGKLYSDPAPLKKRSLSIAGSSISAVIYAQTRGDLLRIYTASLLAGADYQQTAIPEGFDAPKSSADFEAEPMSRMFEEGYRLIRSGKAWRTIPPGTGPGESVRSRASTVLTEQKQGPAVNTQRKEATDIPDTFPINPIPTFNKK